jgi:hypothetical protein
VLQGPMVLRQAPPGAPSRRRPSRWATLWRAVSPVGTAWAHCPAVTGVNHLFRLDDGATPVYTALLSVTSFTPNAAKWRKALEGRTGKILTLTLARAVFGDGDVREGPFVASTKATFTVRP